MEQHLRKFSIQVLPEEVIRVEPGEGCFFVKSDRRAIRCEVLVVASGTKPKRIPSLAVPEAVMDRVLYEIYPIRNVRGKRIFIVGAGDAAFDYALGLEAQNDVTVLNRGVRRRCLGLLWSRTKASDRVVYRENAEIEQVAERSGGGLNLGCLIDRRRVELGADYVVVAVGREPELGFLSEQVVSSIPTLRREGTLHLIGDVRTGSMRQTAIAVGDGVRAAMMISRKLQGTQE
jgi:thioredoxin reductase